jgi:hypothetical protein
MRLPQDSAAQRLLLELELEELLLLLLLLDERLLGWLGATPTARAARFTPFSHPRKNPCTAESARPPLALLFELRLLDEFELLLLDEFDDELLEELFEELLEEFEDELLEELLDEFDEEFEEELPDELELLFELLLPALNLSGDTLFSTSCAASVSARADPRLWA